MLDFSHKVHLPSSSVLSHCLPVPSPAMQSRPQGINFFQPDRSMYKPPPPNNASYQQMIPPTVTVCRPSAILDLGPTPDRHLSGRCVYRRAYSPSTQRQKKDNTTNPHPTSSVRCVVKRRHQQTWRRTTRANNLCSWVDLSDIPSPSTLILSQTEPTSQSLDNYRLDVGGLRSASGPRHTSPTPILSAKTTSSTLTPRPAALKPSTSSTVHVAPAG
jgi:hypothetical protein